MVEIVMPRLSDTMEEGTILRWLKRDGEHVSRGEELVEIETDKATMNYLSDQEGVLQTVAREGDTLAVGELIAWVGDPSTAPPAGEPPGILAYVNGEPAGWCGLGPRAGFRRLEKSKVLAPVDDRPAWSVVCFFVARPYRRQGLSVRLLREAVRHAAARGATLVEGYPTDTRSRAADAFVWTGLASAFERAGFREVARRSRTRPIMRRPIRGARRSVGRTARTLAVAGGTRHATRGPVGRAHG